MNLLPIPTDNLYKFIALTGAALLIASIAFPLSKIDKIELAVQQTQAQRRVLEVQAAALELDLNGLAEDVKRLGADVNARPRSFTSLKEQASGASTRLTELTARKLELQIKKAEIEGNVEKASLLLQQMTRTWSYLKVGGFIGLAMANVGFFLWYRRVQRPADLESQRKASAPDA